MICHPSHPTYANCKQHGYFNITSPSHPRDSVPRYTMFGVRNAINNMQVFELSSMPLGISSNRPTARLSFLQLCLKQRRSWTDGFREMSRIKQKAYRGWLLLRGRVRLWSKALPLARVWSHSERARTLEITKELLVLRGRLYRGVSDSVLLEGASGRPGDEGSSLLEGSLGEDFAKLSFVSTNTQWESLEIGLFHIMGYK